MPGWHVFTRKWVESGRLQVVGIVEEQHPDRALLFMQWKQMDWPLLVDSINRLGLRAVPITVLLDEHGIIRAINPSREQFGDLMEQTYPAPPQGEVRPPGRPSLDQLRGKTQPNDWVGWVRLGDACLLWGGPAHLNEAIEAYTHALKLQPDQGQVAFRLGVAYRRRYDSPNREPGDFARAVQYWNMALGLDPNQYIWRRRIQQYGPRLDKPYPFYDWVPEAREAIRQRGETPRPLLVEPGGAEFAHPQKRFAPATDQPVNPDPKGRIARDERGLIRAEVVVVPPTIRPGNACRVHVILRPNPTLDAHWNNEAEPLQLWIDPPEGWQVDARWLSVPNPRTATSDEERRLEFEVRAPAEAPAGRVILPAYALYYVCEGRQGTCFYRRLDIPVEIEVTRK